LTPDTASEKVGIRPGSGDPVFDARDESFVYNLFDYNPPDHLRRGEPNGGHAIPEQQAISMRRKFFNIPTPDDDETDYWRREHALVAEFRSIQLYWRFGEASDNYVANPLDPIYRIAKSTTARYLAGLGVNVRKCLSPA